MSKCVLVMDMPNGCENCVMAKTRHSMDKNYCILTENNFYDDLQKRQDFCPLRELPQKITSWKGKSTNYQQGHRDGYNACIDELLKGEEG